MDHFYNSTITISRRHLQMFTNQIYSNRAVGTCLVRWLVHMIAEHFRGPPGVSVLLYWDTTEHSHNKWEGLTS